MECGAKPDPRVFELAARCVEVEAERCLFVDDTLGHVVAAREAWLTGLHYERVGQLRYAVAPLLRREGRRMRPHESEKDAVRDRE